MNIQAREVENKDVQNVKKDKNIDAPLDTLSTSVANTSSDTKADVTQTSTREKVIQVIFCIVKVYILSTLLDYLL